MSKRYKWEFSKKNQLPVSDDLLWLYKNYVLDCPTPGVSLRGRTLHDIGWRGSDLILLARSISQSSGLTSAHWKYISKPRKDECGTEWERFAKALEDNSLHDGYTLDREFAIYTASGRTKMDALFYMVRNCLAHGSFRLHRRSDVAYIAMQSSKGERIKGRALLSMKTLRSIRQITNKPPAR